MVGSQHTGKSGKVRVSIGCTFKFLSKNDLQAKLRFGIEDAFSPLAGHG
jgi:hypothetical protein